MWGRAALAGSVILAAALVSGVAEHQKVLHVTPKSCYKSIEMGPKFECAGEDLHHLRCTDVQLIPAGKIENCEYLRIVPVDPKP